MSHAASSSARPRIALPDDPTIDALAPALRDALARHWTHRASSELSVAVALEELRPRLRDVGAARVVLDLVDKAIDDERRHGRLCVDLASRYHGSEVPCPAPRPHELPAFGTGDERTEVAMLVTGMCCINESIACAWLRACFRAATSPLAAFANKIHLEDEVDHARLGWAHLASSHVGDAVRASVRARVKDLVRVNVAEWRRDDAFLPPEGEPAHGHLSRDDHTQVIDDAVRDVVWPGLALVGVA